ncbi:MAG: FAD:protein FMN transferase, partial [Candidatus Moranbacteria bacterium]|nr:FAD:protein FMN transferase [Candidatus Moranbacteria bacterium]
RYQVSKEIMNTDILCEIMHLPEEQEKAEKCLRQVFSLLRNFEDRFSRFKKDNELWHLNHSHVHAPSKELFELLSSSQYFHHLTQGLFDPSILPALENEGYASGQYTSQKNTPTFSELILTTSPPTVTKPDKLFVDFGGIGKGYIVDQVAAYLSLHFENFLIDAGGDIYTRGVNAKEDYPYWVIEVEHPDVEQDPAALLLLTDMAVATSGRNRRHWIKNEKVKHHIIDPRISESATLDFLSVTVIAPSVISADVLAKTLFISGKDKALTLAEDFHIPAVFIKDDGTVIINSYAQPYVWQAS